MDIPGILICFRWHRQLLVIFGTGLLTAVFVMLTGCGKIQPVSPKAQHVTIPASSTVQALREIDTAITAQTNSTTAIATNTPENSVVTTVTPVMLPMEKPSSATAVMLLPVASQSPESTLLPTGTLTPTAVQQPTETPFPTQTEVEKVVPVSINGVSQESIVIMPDNVRQHVREIYGRGQSLGRNPNAFSKLGDSVTLTDHYLTRFDSGHYTLGPYAYLQPTIDHYSGSFSRYGVATRVGLHAWSIFDPLWANKEWCSLDEHMVACEIRLFNPSVILVKIGSNDNGAASAFDQNVRQLVEYAAENGVIPVLATKADRFEGPDDRNNQMLRQIAAEYEIPLWDYDLIAETLPRRGLSGDDVHMTMADSDDYTDPATFERGYPVSDLTALMMLHALLQEVTVVSDS